MVSTYFGTALYNASEYGHAAAVSILLDRAADGNIVMHKSTPLITAAERGHLEVVEALVSWKKIDLNRQDQSGETALRKASDSNRVDTQTSLGCWSRSKDCY